MKTPQNKNPAKQQPKKASQSFFHQGSQQAFFSEQSSENSAFFPPSLQLKTMTGETPFFSPLHQNPPTKPPNIQRTPAFESEQTIQTKMAPEEEGGQETAEVQMQSALSGGDGSAEAENNHLQFRLTIGQPGDRYEQEAEAIADEIVTKGKKQPPNNQINAPQPPQISRKPESSNSHQETASGSLESRLQQQKGQGTPLDKDTRSEMEGAFDSDFSQVQIHSGQEATSLNQSLGAKAFTHGQDIFFNTGEYQPNSDSGKHLIAHELTHTIQQGHGIQRSSTPNLQKAPTTPGNQPLLSSEVVNVSTNLFNPSDKVKEEIKVQRNKGLEVRVIIPGLTSEGRVKIKLDRQGNYQSMGWGSMTLLNPWAQQLGGLYINFKVNKNQISGGFASLTPKRGKADDWLKVLQQNSKLLGGLGLNVSKIPNPINKFESGKLILGAKDLNVEVGGVVAAKFNISLENTNKPKIDGSGKINIKGMAEGTLTLDNSKGKLTGEVVLAINIKSFSGEGKVKYNPDGTVDVGGKAAYNANKLSGEINFVATDLDSANKFGKNAIKAAGGKENVQKAPPPAPVPPPKTGKKERALAATGQLGFNLTNWFAGTVNVVVDGKGDVTVIGKIAPPAQIELFKQKDWDKELFKFEAKAYYGVPLVGNLNLFANISLRALAKLGPAKLYNIEILGTYSTDPDIQKNIQISGSLNISAYAGLRLRAEGGAGIELVGHDLKFGIGLNGDIGVKAYADARPTIGYREPDVFYIGGTLELVAQPMLGLSGDFFIELDSPWWSPAPDKKWTWPMFSKEWPLGDPMGISASLKDYELGSGKVPEVELKQPKFDPSKFMSNMVDNKLPNKSGAKTQGQGKFKEDGSVRKPDVAPKKAGPKPKDVKPGKKGTPPPSSKSAKPSPKGVKDQNTMKLLANATKLLPGLKAKAPLAQVDLNKELAKIKGQVRGVTFNVQPKGEMWVITPKAGGKMGSKFELKKAGKDTETKQSKEVKANIAQELKGKTIKNFTQEKKLLDSIYNKYHSKGLKSIKFDKRGNKIGVIISASLAEEVTQLDLSQSDNWKRLLEIIKKIHYLAKGSTWLFAYYNGEKIAEVKNIPATRKKPRQHAEQVFIKKHLETLRQRMIDDVNGGRLEKDGLVNIHWDITRSPCINCAEHNIVLMIDKLKGGGDRDDLLANLKINLTIKASSIEGKTGEEGVRKLLESDIEIKATDIWDVIRNKMKQNSQFYLEDNPELIYHTHHFDDYKSRASVLQNTINKVIAERAKDMSK